MTSPFKQYTFKDITSRLTEILNFKIQTLKKHFNEGTHILTLNESLLEQYCDLLSKLVIIQPKPIKSIQPPTQKPNIIKKLTQPYPCQSNSINKLLAFEQNAVKVYTVKQNYLNSKKKYQYEVQRIGFQEGVVKKFWSYHILRESFVVFVGGSQKSNPNMKSKDVMGLNLKTRQISKLGHLPSGVSSHTSIYHPPNLYIIGGNHNHNIVSKKCYKYNLQTNTSIQIQSLNYPSASHSLLLYKNKYIYKIGGIGSSFGQWNLSPYIERYLIQEDFWEVVNPQIRETCVRDDFCLFSGCFSYRSLRGIVVVGGFNFSVATSVAIEIQIDQNQEGEDLHSIVNFGQLEGLQKGGFCYQGAIQRERSMICLQNMQDLKYNEKPLLLSTTPTYL